MKQKKEIVNIQISAGRGPAECCWVVAQVLKVMLVEIKKLGLQYDVVNRNQGTQAGTLSSCMLRIVGKGAIEMSKDWMGTIQWIGKSPYRKFHKRKNWFVGVSAFNDFEKYHFREQDLEFQTYRASGPGGQHRNKVETAVRVIHKPSGLTVSAADSKSQMQNKKNAVEKMRVAMDQFDVEQMQKQIDEQWYEHLNLERGNPVKVFTGNKFK